MIFISIFLLPVLWQLFGWMCLSNVIEAAGFNRKAFYSIFLFYHGMQKCYFFVWEWISKATITDLVVGGVALRYLGRIGVIQWLEYHFDAALKQEIIFLNWMMFWSLRNTSLYSKYEFHKHPMNELHCVWSIWLNLLVLSKYCHDICPRISWDSIT